MLTSLAASLALALGQVQPTPPTAASPPSSRQVVPVASFGQPTVQIDASQANSPVAPAVNTVLTPAENGNGSETANDQEKLGFVRGVLKAYKDSFFPDPNAPPEEPAKRRALPQPWSSPPFPGHEYQGYPLIGVPPEPISNPLMMGLYNTRFGDALKASKLQVEGWVTSSYNWSQAKNSNSPTSYWIVPNRLEMDQAVLRFSRQADTVQQDHIDWGFRSTFVYGEDYRYLTAGGWLSDQLLKNNRLYGFDPTEQYFDVYIPGIAQGMVVRVGRWIACPDIETQFAPDNYMASHSILFTYDTYTQTGIMLTFLLNEQWIAQVGVDAGNDMAPWYRGAQPCGFLGLRWTSKANNDAIYTCLNQINSAEFQHFTVDGQPAGHDNFNYLVSTWEHKFNDNIHTKTEGYFMWQRNAELGGTPSLGAPQFFGGGGGDGTLLPGYSLTYGLLNYTMFAFTKNDYFTVRNEWWRDERGMRSGVPGTYTSHTIGWSHNFNSSLQIRPEIGYYRNWTNPAFDLSTKNGILMAGFDFTIRF
jgi:Putative beta-barrel porin-2, OmpL-like. bbp2